MQYLFKDSPWDTGSVVCHAFYHVDWRENDIIAVYSPTNERIGFIVSQSVVFTDDSEIVEHKTLSNYLSCWLKAQLNCRYIELSMRIDDDLIPEDNLCYLLLHKPSLSYFADEQNSILAFMFSNCFSSEMNSTIFFSNETYKLFRNKIEDERMRIHSIFSNEASKYFINECIPKLHSSSEPLSQFIILYQFFEVLMEISFEPKLKVEYKKFENQCISKNDFRQIVSNLSKESTLIAELLRKISNKSFEIISAQEKLSFLGDSNISSTSEFVYKLRNSILHRTRIFMNSEDMLRKVNFVVLNCIYECMVTDIFEVNNLTA